MSLSSQSCIVSRFNHLLSDPALWPHFGLPELCETNVCHTAELPIVFAVKEIRDPALNVTLTPAEQQLSSDMDSLWTAFIKNGKENVDNDGNLRVVTTSGVLTWPLWNETTRLNLVINDTFSTEDSVDLCTNLWDKLGYNF